MLVFIGARIEFRQNAGAKTLNFGGIVHAVTRPLIECASVFENVSAPRFVDMEANHLLADGTLRPQRVKPPPAEELAKLDDPYG